MAGETVSAKEFDRVKRLHCRRWEARSLDAVRALLVDRKRISDVAEQFGMKPQQVNVLRARFFERMRREAAVKLPASQFMGTVAPANSSVLEPFKADIKQLVKRGYSTAQIADFLRANDIKVPARELNDLVGAINENSRSSESKGRRR